MKPKSDIKISIVPKKIVRFLAFTAFILVIISLSGQLIINFYDYDQHSNIVSKIAQLFDVGLENNIPTHFSALLLFISAILLAIIGQNEIKQQSWLVLYWRILSLGFLFMAFDETYRIHEQLIEPFQNLLGGENLGFLYFAWVIPYSIIVLLVGVFFYKFLFQIPSTTRNRFIIAAAFYLGGAIGVELIGGYYMEINQTRDFTYVMIQTVEESLEIVGILIFIWALLKKVKHNIKEVRLVL